METTKDYHNKAMLIKLDKKVLSQLEIDSLQIPVALFLMTQQWYVESQFYDATFEISPKKIYKTMMHETDSTRNSNARNKLMDALLFLHNNELITIEDATNIRWDGELEIDASNLFHKDNEPYVSITTTELAKIMRKFGIRASKPIVAYFNVTSYFDWRDMSFYMNEYIVNKRSLAHDIYYDADYGQGWHISCYASLETLASKPYNNASINKWITEKTLSKYLHELEELDLIAIVEVEGETPNGKITTYHYCLPQYKQGVEIIAKRKMEQMLYVSATGKIEKIKPRPRKNRRKAN